MENNRSKKILIADDEAYIRLLIEQTLEDLEEAGVEIITAENGSDALRIIQEEEPQLVFMDVMMPKMNGFDVCRAVKHELQLSGVYIVLVTAKGQGYDRQTGEEAGADRYITKPFDPDEVLTLAKNVLSI
jgi:two-component system, OmpR family, alkaline phosphatase synthesis response regulator PhoP